MLVRRNSQRLRYGFAVALAASALHASDASAQGIVSVARQATPATVTILTLGPGGDTLGIGSGFVVRSDGVIITNYHVMRGADAAIVRFASGETFVRVAALEADASHDIAVLKIPGFGLPVLAPALAIPPVGEKVIAIGAPRGLDFTVSEGIVSAVRMDNGKQWIQMSAPISPGSSGGPVLNGLGHVVGISTMYRTDGQNLNFAVPIKYAMGLVSGSSAPQPLAAVFTTRNEASAAFARESAGVSWPEPSTRADASWLVDTYSMHGTVTYGAEADAPEADWNGLFLAAGTNAGLLVWRWADTVSQGPEFHTTIISNLFATARGRLLFSFADWIHEGYFTDDGGFVLSADTIDAEGQTSSAVIASPMQLGLDLPTGLYSVRWQSLWHDQGSELSVGDVVSWTGKAAIAVVGDTVHAVMRFENTAGGSTYFWSSGPGSAERFVLEMPDGSSLVGRVGSGQLSGYYRDAREDGAFAGAIRGRRE